MSSYFNDILSFVVLSMTKHGQYPTFYQIDEVLGSGERCIIDGQLFINMGSNGYLGLQKDPEVLAAAMDAINRYGLGAGGSRITAGTTRAHLELEEKIAEFEGTEAAIVFSSGFLGNTGLIQALSNHPMKWMLDYIEPIESKKLFGPNKVHIIFDSLIHRSLINGIECARGSMVGFSKPIVSSFANGDYAHLERILQNSKCPGKLVVVDTIFSLHGRRADIGQIAQIANRYGADVYVDEAHATGVFGPHGRGLVDEAGCDDKVKFHFMTLSKAIGAEGGGFVGTKEQCDAFRVSAPWIFSTSMAPAVAAGAKKSIEIIMREPERREKLHRKAKFFREAIIDLGFDVLGLTTQIVPVRFYTKKVAQEATYKLMEKGIFAPCYWYPAVGKTEAMVRMNIMATHSEEQLQYVVDVLKSLRDLAQVGCSEAEHCLTPV